MNKDPRDVIHKMRGVKTLYGMERALQEGITIIEELLETISYLEKRVYAIENKGGETSPLAAITCYNITESYF